MIRKRRFMRTNRCIRWIGEQETLLEVVVSMPPSRFFWPWSRMGVKRQDPDINNTLGIEILEDS